MISYQEYLNFLSTKKGKNIVLYKICEGAKVVGPITLKAMKDPKISRTGFSIIHTFFPEILNSVQTLEKFLSKPFPEIESDLITKWKSIKSKGERETCKNQIELLTIESTKFSMKQLKIPWMLSKFVAINKIRKSINNKFKI